jgi:spore coat polysaccharide biosynthesis protein SpsF
MSYKEKIAASESMRQSDHTIICLIGRMGSKRLGGKIIKKISPSQSILDILVYRAKKCQNAKDIVLCTSDYKDNDILEKKAKFHGIKCFRGSELDVMKRLLDASAKFESKHIVRLTCDNPLYDPSIVDEMIDLHISECSDYTYNKDLPVGMRPEVYSVDYLKFLESKCTDKNFSSHLTFFAQNDNKSRFKKTEYVSVVAKTYDNPVIEEIRLTVDYPQDIELLRRLSDICEIKDIGAPEIIALFENNRTLLEINRGLLNPAQNNDREKCTLKE